jgi:hypothetical protein
MPSKLHAAFVLGVMAAEYVHGIRRKGDQVLTDAIFDTLRGVATGDMTLINTPEETNATLPGSPAEIAGLSEVDVMLHGLAAEMPGLIRQAMRDQRQVAAELLKELTEMEM